MIIKFANEKEFEYINAYTLDRDFKDGFTRPSIEVSMYIAQTSYNEIEEILSNETAVGSFMLIGEPEPIFNELGEIVGYGEVPMSEHKDYTIKGKISIEDGIITFKMYRLSDIEIENRDAKQAIDELLIAMEV